MIHGENTTVILYQVQTTQRVIDTEFLKVRVMVAFRDYHSVTHENLSLKNDCKILTNGMCLQPYDTLPPMYLFHNAHSINNASFWYKNMEYPKKLERGLEAHEDHFSPFALYFDLNKGGDFFIVASTKEYDKVDIFELPKDCFYPFMNTYLMLDQGLFLTTVTSSPHENMSSGLQPRPGQLGISENQKGRLGRTSVKPNTSC